jgi:hypothetical protein
VISRYNPETLQAIAEASNGTFVGAEVTDKATRVRAALQRLRATSRTVSAGASKTPRFQWFVAPGALAPAPGYVARGACASAASRTPRTR